MYNLLLVLAYLRIPIAIGPPGFSTCLRRAIQDIEKSIVAENCTKALDRIEEISDSYKIVFLRDYKIATRLAIYSKDFESAFKYMKLGISDGWTLKEIKKNKFVKTLIFLKEWPGVEANYEALVQTCTYFGHRLYDFFTHK